MTVLHHHRGDAKRSCGTQNGADIVGIGKLIQHQDQICMANGTQSVSHDEAGAALQ